MSYYGDYKQPKQEQDGVWNFLNRLVVVLLAFVLIAGIIGVFLPKFRQQKEMVARQEDLKRQIAEQNALLALHTRQEDWLKDPDYVATLARDRLDLMKPGETIIRLEPGPSSDAQGLKSTQHQ